MNDRWRNTAPLIALGIAGTALVIWLILKDGVASSPLASVPEDSFLVMTVDMASIAESPLVDAFVDKDGKAAASGKILGLDAMTESCGFNPLTRIRALAVAVPEGGETGDFGVIATGALTRDELLRCAQATIAKRGGDAKVAASGSFTVVEDTKAAPGEGAPKVAFRDGGPYLVGHGAWLDRMMATAEGRAPSIDKNAGHQSLRASLYGRDAQAKALVVTAILPKQLRDRLKSEMSDDDRGPSSANNVMAGVLDVASAGLAVRAGGRGADTWAYAELRCESPASCDEVAKLLARKRFAWSRDFMLRFAGLGPGIDNFETHPDPANASTLLVSTHLPGDSLAGALEQALSPKKHRTPAASPSASPMPGPGLVPPNTTPMPGTIPDEVIRPANSGISSDAGHGAKPALPTADAGGPMHAADASTRK